MSALSIPRHAVSSVASIAGGEAGGVDVPKLGGVDTRIECAVSAE